MTWPCSFVANADDPVLVSTVPAGATTHWVADGFRWTRDSSICPVCHATLHRDGTHWWCASCGSTRPTPDWRLEAEVQGPGLAFPLALQLPGAWPRANALFAIAAATALGVESTDAAEAISKIDDVEGRYRVYRFDGREVRLIMVKNAASWDAALTLAATGVPIVLAQEAFGIKDMASPWEIDMAGLAGTTVVATGQRRRDVAARLDAAGVEYTVVEDPLQAIRSVPRGPVHVIANYTAFLDLRRALPAS
jgi:UDP-N-acetylmuramyl tripeptide synthase